MSKKLLNKSVLVKWADACGESKVDKAEIENIPPKSLLVVTDTYGVLHAEDEYAVLILQENSDISVDYTVVPKGMIISMTELK